MEVSKKDNILGLGLVSGGLDSLIASLILKLQDIEVVGLNFKSPFCNCDKAYKNSQCGLNLYYEKLDIKIVTQQKKDDYLELIRNPKYGYGRNLNPCIDCRIYLIKKAKEYGEKIKADFIFTGEVLNQRPKSQNLTALKIIEEESGLQDKLLRPLSARLLKPTIFEEEGLVDRSKLLAIKGRSRKIQLELAKKYDILDEYYACGGCLLTDMSFSNRMRDYLKYTKHPKMKDINILKIGRHFRYNNSKIIVGRDEIENRTLIQIKKPEDWIMEATDVTGPITIIQGKIDDEVLEIAAKLTLRYSDFKGEVGSVIYKNSLESLNRQILVEKEKSEAFESYFL